MTQMSFSLKTHDELLKDGGSGNFSPIAGRREIKYFPHTNMQKSILSQWDFIFQDVLMCFRKQFLSCNPEGAAKHWLFYVE